MIQEKSYRDIILFVPLPNGGGFEIRMALTHSTDEEVKHIKAIFARFDKVAAEYTEENK